MEKSQSKFANEAKSTYSDYNSIRNFEVPADNKAGNGLVYKQIPPRPDHNSQLLSIAQVCEAFDIFTFTRYQAKACTTKSYPEKNAIIYPALGLAEEAGEVCGKIKKWLRGDVPELDKAALTKEMGDVLWYLSSLADDLGISFEDVARTNIDKLAKRKATGTLKGSGDNREDIAIHEKQPFIGDILDPNKAKSDKAKSDYIKSVPKCKD